MFKVGDRVRVIDSGRHYSTYDGWIKKNAPEFYTKWSNRSRDSIDGLIGTVKVIAAHEDMRAILCLVCTDNGHLFLIGESGLEKIDSQKILITHDGHTTLARLYEGNNVIKSAKAQCAPCDVFDFLKEGAPRAFERLIEDKPKELLKLYCIKEYKPGRFLTKGKVYQTDKKSFTFDDGWVADGRFDWETARFASDDYLKDHFVPLVIPSRKGRRMGICYG